jgi:hypothetical protein
MDCALTSRGYHSNLKKTTVKIFFLFHLGNGMFIINVTQSTFPLTVEFDACQILPCGDLTSQLQLQGYSFYMCPIPGPIGKLVSVHSGWVWGGTLGIKTTLPPFYDNPKDWTRPQDTGKTPISTIQNNQESFNRLQLKLQLFRTHLSPCKD